MSVKAAIVGASGYTGVEAIRLLAAHPGFHLEVVTSDSVAGRRVSDEYPALWGLDLVYEPHDMDVVAERADVAFLAVPHTAALVIAPSLLGAGVRVIDLSADFRLVDPDIYERWYGTPHTAPALLDEAVYGLPEVSREGLADARLVACAGCYPTAAALAATPALRAGLSEASGVVVDAKSGVSGAGRSATAGTHFCAVDESISPYKVTLHRHTPEMEQALTSAAGRPVRVTFSPHLVPMRRGLLATVYLAVSEGVTEADVRSAYEEAYSSEPFVTLLPAGSMPATGHVRGTNHAHVGIAFDEHTGTVVAACAIDNLVKGASGQAVQCANAALGFDETTGLTALGPVV